VRKDLKDYLQFPFLLDCGSRATGLHSVVVVCYWVVVVALLVLCRILVVVQYCPKK